MTAKPSFVAFDRRCISLILLAVVALAMAGCGGGGGSSSSSSSSSGGGGGDASSGDSTSLFDSGDSASGTVRSVNDVIFASGVDADERAVDAASSFPTTVATVYAFASWAGVSEGTPGRSIWYLDGVEAENDEFLWSLGPSGTTWIASISREGGLPTGLYTWELYLDDALIVTGSFTVSQ